MCYKENCNAFKLFQLINSNSLESRQRDNTSLETLSRSSRLAHIKCPTQINDGQNLKSIWYSLTYSNNLQIEYILKYPLLILLYCNILQWRKFKVQVEDSNLDYSDITAGVPQGRLLSPELFIRDISREADNEKNVRFWNSFIFGLIELT